VLVAVLGILAPSISDSTGRETSMGAMVVVQGNANLLHVVPALHSPRRLPRALHRRQEQADQNADNGDDDQEFNKRKTTGWLPATASSRPD
jgi:hypothetical protein